ncbi:phosphoenolpyruvate--protein phosphotransferase [Sphaerisporangium sp. TRM90804]|uniref:phosphoenolpyruvate--protein phosphotransferase n=1 Tax=Sphaerisporangium sp. TRM90804 TaxID=3031113 RepID=UPI00244820FE|nr:phosphoenolpyruvate--protein phosphotransferase [Sphaerisporangium sp. TRM90804]MDH2427274.1 phosphoenolpyruvate--protein phosphotransferase [Sphaerisporangium sp. TRM90804]
MPETVRGLGVSPGRAAGRAHRMAGPPPLPAPRPVSDAAGEVRRATEALRSVAGHLEAHAAKASDPEAGAILEAQSMIAADPGLAESVEKAVASGLDAVRAVDAACAHHRRALEEAGGYFADRAGDLDDIRNRAVATLLGLPMPGVPDPGHPFVLIADDLAPADTAGLDPAAVLALVTLKGGPTSHTAILARALGLPAVVACRGAAAIEDGTWVSVDGALGEVGVGIGEEAAAAVQREAVEARERRATGHGPGRTADGRSVPLLLNIGSAHDLPEGEGAEGVGLFRTEFLFLDRRDAPGLKEQVAAYAAVLRALPGRRVVIRTLDAGSDKPLPFLGLPEEANPALGVRGLRTSRVRAEVLDTQLDAIAEAARGGEAEVWVMAPMVSTVAEAEDFARRARGRGLSHVGVMVEVPAAALEAGRLLEKVDFLSIGTNDLGQYTYAADRQHGELADLLDPWQPALLRLVAMCAEAGRAAGKPVGVCGEAAADPLLAPVLAGMGIGSLSMSATGVPAVREALGRLSAARCEEIAQRVLAAPDPAAARAAAGDAVR